MSERGFLPALRLRALRRLHLPAALVLTLSASDCPLFPHDDGEPPSLGIIQMAPSIGVTTEKPVVFSVTMRSEKDGPYQYAWDFGDGGASSSKEPGYRYPKPGTYAVSVTVSNKAGQDQKTATINVAAPDSDLYFWTQTPVNGQIQVTIGGITRFITLYHTQFPGCARGSGMAEFTDLPYGTYDYSAVSQSGKTWSGRVTLQEHCRNIPLN